RGPTALVEMTTAAPRTRANSPTIPAMRATVGSSAMVADGAVSTGRSGPKAGSPEVGGVGSVGVVVLMADGSLTASVRRGPWAKGGPHTPFAIAPHPAAVRPTGRSGHAAGPAASAPAGRST